MFKLFFGLVSGKYKLKEYTRSNKGNVRSFGFDVEV